MSGGRIRYMIYLDNTTREDKFHFLLRPKIAI
jgi:hypothetical protein